MGKNESDMELVRRVRAGECRVFGKIVARYQNALLNVARTCVGCAEDAADAVQDALVLAYVHLNQLQDPNRLGAWLRRVTVNACRQQVRARKPTADIPNLARLWENLWNDEFVESHQAMARWAREHVPFPGAAFRQLVDLLVRQNILMTGSMPLGGRQVDLARVQGNILNAMAERVNEESTTTMVTAIVQAERLGANLSVVLNELAREIRDRRWSRAEERAASLPVKMLLPMGLFMIPSLYLMIFGPVIARVVTPH